MSQKDMTSFFKDAVRAAKNIRPVFFLGLFVLPLPF